MRKRTVNRVVNDTELRVVKRWYITTEPYYNNNNEIRIRQLFQQDKLRNMRKVKKFKIRILLDSVRVIYIGELYAADNVSVYTYSGKCPYYEGIDMYNYDKRDL